VHKPGIAAALVAAAAICASPSTARAVDTIPFDANAGLVEIQASVDGSAPVSMLVDTGAGVDVLSSSLGRRYVVVTGKYVSLRLSGERVDLPLGTVNSLTSGKVAFDAPHVGIWSGVDTMGVQGLISATAFRSITATFDFRNHNLIIEDAQTFPERARAGKRIPLILQDDLGIALGLFARFDFGNGQSGLCEIDTGAPGITIDKTLAHRLGVTLAPGDKVAAHLTSIALQGDPDSIIRQPAVTFANVIYDCTVGNSFWQNRTFTLDLPNRYMYVGNAP
jgi:predicted aspartyl protease